MKKIMTTLAILLALTFGGCKVDNDAVGIAAFAAKQARTEQRAQANVVAKSSHLCAAPTKQGKLCTRHVSNGDGTDNAVEAACWQHRSK